MQQFFDTEKVVGQSIGKSLWNNDAIAWDIYMLFDQDETWDATFPKPIDYYHQLNPATHVWVDEKRYQCGPKLTLALNDLL